MKASARIPNYRAAVLLLSLMYASETWTPYSRLVTALNSSHLQWLRKILHISWHACIPVTEVLKQAGMESIRAMLLRLQLRWAGHTLWMSDERLPKQLPCEKLCKGKRSKRGQKKCCRDTLKVSTIQPGAAKFDLVSSIMRSNALVMPFRNVCNAKRGHEAHHHLDNNYILVEGMMDNLEPWLD